MRGPLEPGSQRLAATDDIATLAQEVAQIAQRLARLAPPANVVLPIRHSTASRARSVRTYLKARRQREDLLPAELFAEPAWDLLLDLYAANLEGVPVSVSSACIAAAVPPTTALRWLSKLEELSLVQREDDAADARRTYLRLSPEADEAIERWLTLSPLLDGSK